MSESVVGPFSVGDVRVTLLNGGDLLHSLTDSLELPESAWRGRYDALFAHSFAVPVLCVLIQSPGATVLVDVPSPDFGPEDADLIVPGYTPPPSLISRLAALGVGPEDISHIVISHTHIDHFNGLSAARDDQTFALYPQAQVYVGRADWEKVEADPDFVAGKSNPARMFGPYAQADRITLVDSTVPLDSLADGAVEIVPSPGETPGHLSVTIRSKGLTLHCTGDIYHHWVEVENREWVVGWAHPELTIPTRLALEEAALAQDAMLVASHIRGVGRLVRSGDGVRWQELVVE